MKLTNFQIKNYKVILDTKSVKVDPRVTALVGKNESGKTAVLKAMWARMSPAQPLTSSTTTPASAMRWTGRHSGSDHSGV